MRIPFSPILTAHEEDLAAQAAAAQVMSGPDPIFAAIEAHKAAWAAFDPIEDTDGPAWDAASAAEFAVWDVLIGTCPTTLAGLAGAARYIAEQPDLLLRSEPGTAADALRTLAKALDAIAAVSEGAGHA